tara:strand:+ start:1201 stop:2148 length:948 start_codon:yes stop_codon:yes gene_type:complete
MEIKETNLVPKSSNKFICEKCNFETSRKSQYERHLLTDKHKRKQMEIKKIQKVPDDVSCKCGRLFKTNSGLWKHKKKCNFIVEAQSTDTSSNKIDIPHEFQENQDYKEMFFKIMAENSEFKNLLITQQRQIMDQQKQIGELIPKVGNNNNNTVKQKFNINIFLNEQCRDAINMNDFLKQIEVSLQQLDVTKTKGIAEGLSNVFIENMNKLSIYERPLHCTDAKRETLYIKENDVWEKDIDKSRIRAAIKDASITQYKTMQKWIDANPDYMEDQDKQKYFIDMVRHCGKDLNDIDDKIIRKICTTSYVKDILNEIN